MRSFQYIDIAAIKSSHINQHPFPYTVIDQSLCTSSLPELHQDYPLIHDSGSIPLNAVKYGACFNKLMNELESDEFRKILAEKFNMDLQDKPIMITVRGKSSRRDGHIHTDSKSKLITILLYMNEEWEDEGGCLRLLYDNKNLENYFAEVPPKAGTMIIFKVTENGWHGHKPFIGTRKVIQVNYVTSEAELNKHSTRHRVSSKFKALKRYLVGV